MKPSPTLHEFIHGQFIACVGISYYKMTIEKGWVSDFSEPIWPNSTVSRYFMWIGANNDDQIWLHILDKYYNRFQFDLSDLIIGQYFLWFWETFEVNPT